MGEVPQEEEKADNITDAIKSVIKKSQANDGLVKGLNEVCKALDRKQAILCVLAQDCDDPKYKKLVTALAKSSNIPLIEVEHRNDIGTWLGHCKYDKDGEARKVKGTSSVAIKSYGEETEALSFVLNYIKTHWAQYRPDKGKFNPEQIDPHLCTHIIYAFAKLGRNHELAMYEWNDDKLYPRMMALKEKNPKLKISLAVGGWNHENGKPSKFSVMVNYDGFRSNFIKTAIEFLRKWGFDGLDLDWEY